MYSFFFFNDTATPEIYTLSLHDALPICLASGSRAATATARSSSATRSAWWSTSRRASASPAGDQRRRSHLTSPPLRLKMLAMAQQPPPSNVGQVSGDGRWRWDGHQWVPNTPVLAGGYMVAAQPG